ncbi:MAG: hypothetical protein CMF38_01310 [Legionellaceae bacterium]|mgnify:CR=1 FL=1|nr:hypothetical protein [Legionellaceae bacterium]HAF88141.1 hypothetical protein [Legionellales bacterium]HCA88834.1 hypothetical protein [Legionellales bacterium]|tara:strand:- start:1123 stop:1521 length:399 start_codon:yes stop_codon:yes gene_type:complete
MKFIDNIEGLVASKLTLIKAVWTLFKLETKLAGLNILPLLASIGVLIAIVFTLWFSVMIIIGMAILSLMSGHIFLSLIGIIIINVALLLLTIRFMMSCLNKMSFARTRMCLTQTYQKDADNGVSNSLAQRDT